jgi:hypothetical protein
MSYLAGSIWQKMHEKIPQMHKLMRLWYFFVHFLPRWRHISEVPSCGWGKKRRGCANFDTASWLFLRLEVTMQPLVFVTNY